MPSDIQADVEAGSPDTMPCPVCEKPVPQPLPETCPHCQAPVESILSLLRIADMGITEAMRDLRIGNLESVSRRLDLVRLVSQAHRLKVEAIRAMLARLNGDPAAALATVNSIREQMAEPDEALVDALDLTERLAKEDLEALVACCEHYNFALFQSKRGHYEEAEQAASRALQYVPHHAPTNALMGKIKLALRKTSDARYYLQRALAVDPSNVSAARMLSKIDRQASIFPLQSLFAKLRIAPEWLGAIFVAIAIFFLIITVIINK